MTRSAQRWKNFTRGIAMLTLVTMAGAGCGDSGPADDGNPGQPQDAGIDRVDVTAGDAPFVDRSTDDASLADVASDAGGRDQSVQDRQPDDGSTEAGAPSDADAGAPDASDAATAPDGDGAVDADASPDTDALVDAIDADAAVDTRDSNGRGDVVDARNTDADGGCACTRDDAGAAYIPLECFCANGCPSYDAAMNICPTVPFPEDHRIDTHADCNLVVIHVGHPIGIGGSAYVYDATTHELVGASGYGDFPSQTCGDAQVYGYRAGTFPPSTCPRTSSAQRCVDGGDGG